MIEPRAPQSISDEITKLRSQVARDGGCTIEASRLERLCPGARNAGQQFLQIAAIARAEGWSFAFLRDGAVRFGSYVPSTTRRS